MVKRTKLNGILIGLILWGSGSIGSAAAGLFGDYPLSHSAKHGIHLPTTVFGQHQVLADRVKDRVAASHVKPKCNNPFLGFPSTLCFFSCLHKLISWEYFFTPDISIPSYLSLLSYSYLFKKGFVLVVKIFFLNNCRVVTVLLDVVPIFSFASFVGHNGWANLGEWERYVRFTSRPKMHDCLVNPDNETRYLTRCHAIPSLEGVKFRFILSNR